MLLADLAFALLFAFLLAAALVGLFGWRHPARREEPAAWPAAVFLFLLLFFLIWAGGAWIGPFGPLVWASAWLPFLVVGLVIGLVLLAVAEPPDRRRRPAAREARDPVDEERMARGVMVYGAFFWILMLLLLVAIIAAYAG
jgi:hypothetical protein